MDADQNPFHKQCKTSLAFAQLLKYAIKIDLNIPAMGIFPPDFSYSDQVKLVFLKNQKLFPIRYTSNYRMSSLGLERCFS